MNNIELFTFDNNYGKNFIDSNYIFREGKWIDDDTFIATNKSLHICFIYRCSNNRLTIAFSPFNKNNYNKFKYKFLQNHIGSITEVVIDTHFNEVESS